MTRRVVATLLSVVLVASSCSGGDDAADRPTPTSDTAGTASQTSAATSSAPTTTGTTTLVPATTVTSTSAEATTLAPATSGSSTTIESRFVSVPQAPPPDEAVADGASAATDLTAEQTCDPASPASPAVILSWHPATIGVQLVAVAVLPDGFDTGRYTVTDELPSDRATYGISPLEPGGIYHWRVLTRSGDEWVASDIAQFTGPTCVLDTPSSP